MAAEEGGDERQVNLLFSPSSYKTVLLTAAVALFSSSLGLLPTCRESKEGNEAPR